MARINMHSFDSLGAPSAITRLLWFLARFVIKHVLQILLWNRHVSKSFGQSAAKMYAAAYFLSPGNP
jgi:hypothetical protein